MEFTANTTISFSWRFPNYEGYYIGLVLYTSGQGLYLMSHFSGTYENNSLYMILEYDNEALNTWYFHTVNVSDLFLDYYGELPETISGINVLNRGYSSSSPSDQVSYYDSINISNDGDSGTFLVTTFTTPGFRLIATLGVLSVFVLIFTRKTKKN